MAFDQTDSLAHRLDLQLRHADPRAVVEAAGIKDVMAKSQGSKNHANVVKATLKALQGLRSKDQIYSSRGKRTADQKAL